MFLYTAFHLVELFRASMDQCNNTFFLFFLSLTLCFFFLCFFVVSFSSEQTTAVQSWKGLVRATTQITNLDDQPRLPQDAR